MTTKLAITAFFLFAIVMGIGAISPALAAKGDAPGQNKVTICHFDEEENKYVKITVPPHTAAKHKANHGDVDPVNGECPIIDNTAPIITLIGDNPQTIFVGDAYTELGATAFDDIDGDITGSILIDTSDVDTNAVGTYSVTYNVQDSSGNNAVEVIRTVEVIDLP